jgi:hypothetical protein
MPMIDVQRRHQTIFRIRFGEKNGNRPVKLTDAIRITSANADVVDAFIDVYGGSRVEWDGQWEAKLPTTALNILVLPGQSISQWWEKYRGSVCDRRCPGTGGIETKSNKPCMCDPDIEKRTAARDECSPTTRVSVICPDVAVVGSGMFVCHGLVGAETLPQSIAVAEAALSRGLMVPAVLRVVEFRGRNHFIVPQIEVVGMSFNALAAATATGELQHATRELDAPTNGNGNGNGPRFTPIAPAVDAPSRSMSEQFGEFDEQSQAKAAARAGRANAAAPLPSTGIQPKRRSEGDTLAETVEPSPVGSENGEVSVPPAGTSTVNRVAIAVREAGLDDNDRHNLCTWASLGRATSSKLLTESEQTMVIEAARRIKAGNARLDADDGGQFILKDTRYGWASLRPTVEGEAVEVPLDELRTVLRARLEALGEDGKAGWKAAGLPALARLTEEHRELALTTVWKLEGEPF